MGIIMMAMDALKIVKCSPVISVLEDLVKIEIVVISLNLKEFKYNKSVWLEGQQALFWM